MSQNINNLFKDAQDDGTLSKATVQALAIRDIGNEIQAGLGVSVDSVKSSEVVLLTIMPDDSGSIRMASNSQLVRDGHNLIIDALIDSKQEDNIFVHNRYLNGEVLYPYVPLTSAVRMDKSNYNPGGGTPLYDQTVIMLATVLAKTQEFANNGVPCRTISLIITDGADCASIRATPDKVKRIIDDMLRMENHIVAAMGVDAGDGTDFRAVFKEMGIRPEWILTPKNDKSEIRKAFQIFSQSAIRASQSTNFSQTALAGFSQ